jgi:thiamine biosynthesis lipoprotein
VKFSHTINPVTGFPERNALLSASVFAPDAMTADAYATACMVLGPEKALQMIEKNPSLDAYFVTGTADGKMQVRYSKGLKPILDKQ